MKMKMGGKIPDRYEAEKFRVSELRVRNLESGEIELRYLCEDCEESTRDFLEVLRRRPYDTDCDRCGESKDSMMLKARMP